MPTPDKYEYVVYSNFSIFDLNNLHFDIWSQLRIYLVPTKHTQTQTPPMKLMLFGHIHIEGNILLYLCLYVYIICVYIYVWQQYWHVPLFSCQPYNTYTNHNTASRCYQRSVRWQRSLEVSVHICIYLQKQQFNYLVPNRTLCKAYCGILICDLPIGIMETFWINVSIPMALMPTQDV